MCVCPLLDSFLNVNETRSAETFAEKGDVSVEGLLLAIISPKNSNLLLRLFFFLNIYLYLLPDTQMSGCVCVILPHLSAAVGDFLALLLRLFTHGVVAEQMHAAVSSRQGEGSLTEPGPIICGERTNSSCNLKTKTSRQTKGVNVCVNLVASFKLLLCFLFSFSPFVAWLSREDFGGFLKP